MAAVDVVPLHLYLQCDKICLCACTYYKVPVLFYIVGVIANCVVCWTKAKKMKRNEKLNLTLNKNQGKRVATFRSCRRMDFIVYLSKLKNLCSLFGSGN